MQFPSLSSIHLFFRIKTILMCLLKYRIIRDKRRASNKRRPLISAAPLGINIEISASPLISAAPLNAALIGMVTILY